MRINQIDRISEFRGSRRYSKKVKSVYVESKKWMNEYPFDFNFVGNLNFIKSFYY